MMLLTQSNRQKLIVNAIAALAAFTFPAQAALPEVPRPLWVFLRLVGFGSCAYGVLLTLDENQRDGIDAENRRFLEYSDEIRAGVQLEAQTEIQQIHTYYQNRETQWNQAFQQLQSEYQALMRELNQTQPLLESQKEQMTVQLATLDAQREKLAEERALLTQWHEQAEADLLQREQAFQSHCETHVQAIETQWQKRFDELEAEFQEKKHHAEAWANEQAQKYQALADQALIESYNLKQPDFPPGSSPEELLAREAIRCLFASGVIVKKPFVRVLPKNRFELQFEVLPTLPKDANDKTAVRDVAEAYNRIQKGLLPALRLAVPNCKSDPVIEPHSEGRLRLIFDVSGVDYELQAKVEKERAEAIVDPPKTHLLEFLQENPQICVFADSGAGKTTLINTIAHLTELEFGSDLEVIVTNPKPDEHTDWKKLKYDSFETSIFGLLEAASEILYRLAINTNLYRQGKTYHWTPQLRILDEYSEIAGAWNRCHPTVLAQILDEFEAMLPAEKRDVMTFLRQRTSPQEFAPALLRFCWRVGRSEKVKLLITGQNLKPATLGVHVRDLGQTALIYAGDSTNEGITTRVSSWQKSALEAEFDLRKQKAQDGKASPYFGLFVPKGKKAYFATFPEPIQTLQTPAAPASEPNSTPLDLEALFDLEPEEFPDDET